MHCVTKVPSQTISQEGAVKILKALRMSIIKCVISIIAVSVFLLNLSYPQTPSYSNQDCLSCHGKTNISQLTHDGKVRSLFVDPDEWSQDIHCKGSMTCVDCHTYASPHLHFREGFIDVDCARCHPEEAEENQKNIHLTFTTITAGKELPLCYHCHTKHHILPHDDPSSSVNKVNIGKTCGNCHAEVMVKGILAGTSFGKISGHRKGDFSERFDMRVCTNCHFEDSAHGSKQVYKDFCTRCHDYRAESSIIIGPIHLDSKKMAAVNTLGAGLVFLLLSGMCIAVGYLSRKKISAKIKSWHESMKLEKDQDRKNGE